MEHWYVYYKLQPSQVTRWLPAAAAMFDRVQAQTGVSGRLLRRAEEAGEVVTLMEVYDNIADPKAFGPALDASLLSALGPVPVFDAAVRRIERFRPLALPSDGRPNR